MEQGPRKDNEHQSVLLGLGLSAKHRQRNSNIFSERTRLNIPRIFQVTMATIAGYHGPLSDKNSEETSQNQELVQARKDLELLKSMASCS